MNIKATVRGIWIDINGGTISVPVIDGVTAGRVTCNFNFVGEEWRGLMLTAFFKTQSGKTVHN